MPKKFIGENSKAAQARARKAEKQLQEQEQKQKQLEDEYWEDTDKHVVKKQQRKDDKEKKKIEALEKKKENDRLFEEEMASIKSAKAAPTARLTRADIAAHQETIQAEAVAAREGTEAVEEAPLEENVNRLPDEEGGARNVEEAIAVLNVNEPKVDRHPERRMKAAFQAYEEKMLPILKAENPNLRLSQLKQMIKKDWMKSPENPMIQRQLQGF